MSRSHVLDIDRLAALSDPNLDALGHRLHAWLAAQGRRWEGAGIHTFETPALTDEDRDFDYVHRTFVWRDPEWHVHWVLIPGYEIGPGYEDKRLQLLVKRHCQMESGTEEADVVLERDIVPYGAGAGWDPLRLRARPSMRVEPLLMPATPLLQSTPGIARYIDAARTRRFKWTPGKHKVLALYPEEVGQVLQALGARLPSDVELQWSMSGGWLSLFPWGDQLPRFMWAEEYWLGENAGENFEQNFDAAFRYDYESEAPEWERANGFGVIDPLVASSWCTIDGRLAYLGGAGECFPWQACGEWASFLCAAAVLHLPDSQQSGSHGLRPVIPLTSFDG